MKYTIISNINIEHEIEAENEEQALEIHANQVELPKEYVSNSWELVKVLSEEETEEESECRKCNKNSYTECNCHDYQLTK